MEHNADELDRLARTFWDAGLVMAATLIAAAALSVREQAGPAGAATPPDILLNGPDGAGSTMH